jgi:hypothetical protein
MGSFDPVCPILYGKRRVGLLLVVQIEAELFVAPSNRYAIPASARVLHNVFVALPGSLEVERLQAGVSVAISLAEL